MAEGTLHYLEFFPNIQSLLIVVSPPSAAGNGTLIFSPFKISYKNSSCCDNEEAPPLTICNWWDTPLPPLIPNSMINLKTIPNEGTHVRFKTRPHKSTCHRLEGIRETISSILNVPETGDAPNVIMSCRFCHERLMRHCFKRCLPLPSLEWTETVGDIFCHAHKEDAISDYTHSLFPHRETDILIGEETILVQDSILGGSVNRIWNEDQSSVRCKRCSVSIGHISKDSLKGVPIANIDRYKVCISISNESTKANEKHQEMGRKDEHYFAAKLYRLSEELNCFNFLIKSQTGQPILQIQCFRSVSWIMTNVVDKDGRSSIPKLVLKLLYKLVLKDDTSSTLSNGVMESAAFPLRQCLILYEALLKNHYTLPPSLRNTQKTTDDCFKVSYLELPLIRIKS
ncbi:PREDICTED: E3 ubiquitin-protein ligase E3D-like [Amphimedon queenslandica]|uniref:E3 ubiquitin-protein ligase E3D n=1 Tax=Amphimedon queenslandica TaxID=400682 RepID=A0A1X7V026_AMPQE|nr:PREDICTED: E3 ubiquitin-protein ligase E3D-like [Amphimedon queenslandica]|eukprot:XP_019851387.1 PREDICTED: E3 ubiquitin-protein ligase E3D-like [Amphimedon queenslandica]